jgi:hypothetical protein
MKVNKLLSPHTSQMGRYSWLADSIDSKQLQFGDRSTLLVCDNRHMTGDRDDMHQGGGRSDS